MLNKLLRAPLPEQIVALLEKLEQNPDTSHLQKVESLLDYHETTLTRYEEWVIRLQLRRIRNVIRRAQTLDDVMSIVVDRPTRGEEAADLRIKYTSNLAASMQATKNAISGTLIQHAAAQQAQIAHIHAHQQAAYAQGWTDLSGIFTNGSSQ
jgi:hypothetical protein